MSAAGPLAIVGAGGWGTALAVVLGSRGRAVRLWVREAEICAALRTRRQNPTFLPEVQIPSSVLPTTRLAEALSGAVTVITAMPSQFCRSLVAEMAPWLSPEMALVSATKGLEDNSLMRMTEVARDVLRPRFLPRQAVLSGPSFAREVARGDPTAVVLACEDAALARTLQSELSGPTLRLYTSTDVAGVELAAALKNVIAIAAGLGDGLGCGSNARAALISRGLAEMGRLVGACGGRRETVAGLAGLGDLVLTCTGALSRNRTVGLELAKGRGLEEILASLPTVAEGVPTTAAALRLAAKLGIELPIAAQMGRVFAAEVAPREAVRELMERSLKAE